MSFIVMKLSSRPMKVYPSLFAKSAKLIIFNVIKSSIKFYWGYSYIKKKYLIHFFYHHLGLCVTVTVGQAKRDEKQTSGGAAARCFGQGSPHLDFTYKSLSLKDSITRNYTSQYKMCYFSLYDPFISLIFILDLRKNLESK